MSKRQKEGSPAVDPDKLPADVHDKQDLLELLYWLVPAVAATAALVLPTWLAGHQWPWLVYPLAGLLIYILSYRGWWVWTRRIIDVDAKSGVLEYGEDGPLLLGLSKSHADPVSLNQFVLNTPDQRMLQRLFRCGDVRVGSVYIRNVRKETIDKLKAIRGWHERLPTRQLDHTKSMDSSLQEIKALVTELVKLARSIKGSLDPQPQQTVPLPSWAEWRVDPPDPTSTADPESDAPHSAS